MRPDLSRQRNDLPMKRIVFASLVMLGACASDVAPEAPPAAGFYRTSVLEPGNGFRSVLLTGPFPEVAACERSSFDLGPTLPLPRAGQGRCVDVAALSSSARRLAQGAPYHRVVLVGGTARMTVENPTLNDDQRLALCFFLKELFGGPWQSGACHAAGAIAPAAVSPMDPPVLELRQLLGAAGAPSLAQGADDGS